VVTDLLILRRREPDRASDPAAWERAALITIDGRQVPINEYFLAHPEAVLGRLSAVHGAYSADDLVITPAAGTSLDKTLPAALRDLTASAQTHGLTWTPPDPARTSATPAARRSAHAEGHLDADSTGGFTKVTSGRPERFPVPRSQAGELRALLSLRDTAVSLLDAEAASSQDTPGITRLRAVLPVTRAASGRPAVVAEARPHPGQALRPVPDPGHRQADLPGPENGASAGGGERRADGPGRAAGWAAPSPPW
jgi:hypothetical protein